MNRGTNITYWLIRDIPLNTYLNSYSNFSISKKILTERKPTCTHETLYCSCTSKAKIWTKTTLMYNKEARQSWSGDGTCTLLMSTIKEIAMERNITIDQLDLRVYDNNESIALKSKMPSYGNSGKSKCFVFFLHVKFVTNIIFLI